VRWRRPGHALGIEDGVLVGLVVVQVCLYLRVFARPASSKRPPSPRSWAVYFITSAVIFLIECRLERAFYWAIGAYLGQLLALPWRTALTAAGMLLAGFLLAAFGWTGLAQFGAWEWLIAVGSLAAWVIILTTFDRDDYVFQGVRAGAVGYLLKDLPAPRLIETIRRVQEGEVLIQPEIASRALRVALHRPGDLPEPLSDREREVLVMLAQGVPNKIIADALNIAEGTVKNHVTNILGKLRAQNRTEAANIARRRGLI